MKSGFRSVLAVSGFRLRARLDFSIPALRSGQRGITPAFGYSAPHPSARGTSTLPNNALLSAHYGWLRLPSTAARILAFYTWSRVPASGGPLLGSPRLPHPRHVRLDLASDPGEYQHRSP